MSDRILTFHIEGMIRKYLANHCPFRTELCNVLLVAPLDPFGVVTTTIKSIKNY